PWRTLTDSFCATQPPDVEAGLADGGGAVPLPGGDVGTRASPPQGGQNLLDPGEFHPGPSLRAPAGDLQLVEPEPVVVGDVVGPALPDERLGRGGVRAARPEDGALRPVLDHALYAPRGDRLVR